MKKTIIALLSIAALMVSCTKESTVTPSLKYTGETTIVTDLDGGIFNVAFDANTNWTAALNVKSDVANVSPASGNASVKSVKVAVNPFNEADNRDFTLTITVEGVEPVVVNFHQTGLPFLRLGGTDEGKVTMVGGKATFTVIASSEYSYEFNEDTMTGATIAQNGDEFTISCDESFIDKTSCNVVITMGELQVTVTITKDGLAEMIKFDAIPSEFQADGIKYSLAKSGDKLVVCNRAALFIYNEDLSFVKQVAFPQGVTFTGITSDSKGNIVASEGGKTGEAVKIYRLAAGNLEGAFEKFIEWTVATQGPQGVGNVKAEGDVFGNGVVTLFSCGGWATASEGVSWDVNAGTAADAQVVEITMLPTTVNSPDWGIYFPYGTKSADGFCACGYPCKDATVGYYLGYFDTEWTISAMVPDNGLPSEYGYNGADVIEFNGKKLCAYTRMDYFGGQGNEVILVDITDPKNGKVLCSTAYTTESASMNNYYTSIILSATTDAVYAYFVDGTRPAWGVIKYVGI